MSVELKIKHDLSLLFELHVFSCNSADFFLEFLLLFCWQVSFGADWYWKLDHLNINLKEYEQTVEFFLHCYLFVQFYFFTSIVLMLSLCPMNLLLNYKNKQA
jgi:hypothetical protein